MYIFIVNPIAGFGRAKKMYEEIVQSPIFTQLQTKTYHTKYHGHAKTIANEINEKVIGHVVQGIVIMGGDGTLHEVVNGLRLRHLPVSFLPGGSGNDFQRGMNITNDPNETLKAIKNNTHTIDYWLGTYKIPNQLKQRYFVNCLGFGFDAVVAKSANQPRYKGFFNRFLIGSFVYLFALLKELIFFKPISITVSLDGVEKKFSQCFLFIVNNHPYIGGGMKINPHAQNNETEFSIIIVDSISKWKVFALFSTIFFGQHLRYREVTTFQAKNIKVSAKESVLFQADGEPSYTTYCSIKKPQEPMSMVTVRKDEK